MSPDDHRRVAPVSEAAEQALSFGQGRPPKDLDAVDERIALQRQHRTAGVLFGHTDQAGVRQGHGHRGVAGHQRREQLRLRREPERRLQHPAMDEQQHRPRGTGQAPQREAGLGEHRLTRDQGWLQAHELRLGPVVMGVAAVQQRHEGPGIQNDQPRHHQRQREGGRKCT